MDNFRDRADCQRIERRRFSSFENELRVQEADHAGKHGCKAAGKRRPGINHVKSAGNVTVSCSDGAGDQR